MGSWLGAARTPGVDGCTETPQWIKKRKTHILRELCVCVSVCGRAPGCLLFVLFVCRVGAWEM